VRAISKQAAAWVLVLSMATAMPLRAAPGQITITSFIRVTENIGEVRGKVALNEDKAALVTVTNGNTAYSTATDANGGWALMLALRSNTVTATARALDGTSRPASTPRRRRSARLRPSSTR
jgi:hypothetical protein